MEQSEQTAQPEQKTKKSDFKWFVIVVVVIAIAAGWLLFKEGLIPGMGGEKDDRTSVLLICCDGLRLERLGCNGFTPDVTPNLNKLIQGGTLFTQCITAVPLSIPAWATLMTATDPYVHSVRLNSPEALGQGHNTLAEILSDRGYPTAARVSTPQLFKNMGLDQGIWPNDFFDPEFQKSGPQGRNPRGGPVPVAAKSYFDPKEVANSTITWLRNHGDKAFFFWAQFADPTLPLNAPDPFMSRFAATDPYMAELAYFDEQLGRILDEIAHQGLQERTLVVLAASYGEGLGSHAEAMHGWFLYDSTTRVPLLFSQPGRIPKDRRVAAQARLIDVVPTILELVGMEGKPDAQGTSLVPLIDGSADDLGLAAYSETFIPYQRLQYFPPRSLRKAGWKLIHAPEPELYDLTADPNEEKNLASENPEKLAAMQGELFKLITGSASLPELDVAQDGVYAGPDGGYNEAAFLQCDGKNPMGHRDEINLFAFGQLNMTMQQPDVAIENFKKLLELDPDLFHPMQLIATLLLQQNRVDELIAYLKEFLDKKPDNLDVRFAYAELLEKQGQRALAIEEMEWIEKNTPADSQHVFDVHAKLGDMYYADGRLEDAEVCFRKLLDNKPATKQYRLKLIALLTDADRLDDAVEEFRQMNAPQPGGQPGEKPGATPGDQPAHLLHYMLGKMLAAQRLVDQGVQHLKKAVELKPDAASYHNALGSMLGIQGDLKGSLEALQAAEKLWPKDKDVANNLANAHRKLGDYAAAVVVLQRNCDQHPEANPGNLSLLAWILATCPDGNVRSGDKALESARKACAQTQNQDPMALRSLTVALAEKGLFAEAQEAAIQAAQQFVAKRQNIMAQNMQVLTMKFLKNNQPYHEKPPADEAAPAGDAGDKPTEGAPMGGESQEKSGS